MKSLASLIFLGLLVGCSSTAWKDTGEEGPWCAPNTRARVFYRTVDFLGAPNPQEEVAYACKSGGKKVNVSSWRELDSYFGKCTFIKQWPESNGTVNGVRQHLSPFDLCLVAMNPTVIVGAARQDTRVSSLDSPATKKYVFIGSTFLDGFIEVRTILPYHPGAKVVWFSPAVDYDLHQIDLGAGTASFTISKNEQITVTVEGAQLSTLRK